jgi:hypothetical protein
MAVAIKEIEAERAMSQGIIEGDDELDNLNPTYSNTAYKGANKAAPYPYQGGSRASPYQQV